LVIGDRSRRSLGRFTELVASSAFTDDGPGGGLSTLFHLLGKNLRFTEPCVPLSLVVADSHEELSGLSVSVESLLKSIPVLAEPQEDVGLASPGASLSEFGAGGKVELSGLSVTIESPRVLAELVEDLGLAVPGVSQSDLVASGKEELSGSSEELSGGFISFESLLVLAESREDLGLAPPGFSLPELIAGGKKELSGVCL
jgi:hypothetical protein